MASTARLFSRLLQAIIHRVWVVLFFLTAFSVVTMANHWWSSILKLYQTAESWILVGIDTLRQ